MEFAAFPTGVNLVGEMPQELLIVPLPQALQWQDARVYTGNDCPDASGKHFGSKLLAGDVPEREQQPQPQRSKELLAEAANILQEDIPKGKRRWAQPLEMAPERIGIFGIGGWMGEVDKGEPKTKCARLGLENPNREPMEGHAWWRSNDGAQQAARRDSLAPEPVQNQRTILPATPGNPEQAHSPMILTRTRLGRRPSNSP
jgi:hypothetical protein